MDQVINKNGLHRIEIERLKTCLKSVREIRQPIENNSLIVSDLNFESIDVVDLLFVIEHEFRVVMTMLEFNQFVLSQVSLRGAVTWDFTVEELKEYIEARS